MGKYGLCVQKAVGATYGGGDFEKTMQGLGKCVDNLAKTWPKVGLKYPGTSCSGARYTDNGDLTFTDNLTRRVWEKKTDDGTIHDVDDTYSWSAGSPWKENGTAFASFFLNLTLGAFGGSNAWRMPTLAELNSLVEPGYPNCTTPPCTTVPGETFPGFHWSSSTNASAANGAWGVFFNGGYGADLKFNGNHVRAVRGG